MPKRLIRPLWKLWWGDPETPYGSRLLGTPEVDPRALLLRTRALLIVGIVAANLAGVAFTVLYTVLVLPLPVGADQDRLLHLNTLGAGAVVLVSIPGTAALVVLLTRWQAVDNPTPKHQRRTLRLPLLLVGTQAIFWVLATVVLTAINGGQNRELGFRCAPVIVLSGITTCTIGYLLNEITLRPLAARTLAAGLPRAPFASGVTFRTAVFSTLGCGVPLLGVVLAGFNVLTAHDVSITRFSLAMIVLGAVGIVNGTVVAQLAARAVADPVRGLRRALAQVREGSLDAAVQVYDGTEIGQLQAGFNEMITGLRERERIRDLFGRYVGEDVMRAAVAKESDFAAGELREVSVLFVDIVGSTTLGESLPATRVVTMLNRFFTVVVDVVDEHGGLVNKFLGDAALAVFGAPVDQPDHAGHALAAARSLATRLRVEVAGMAVGIGVASGRVVAGPVGDARRYEYTVIGDPVNEAARLTELAKNAPGGVLASTTVLARADHAESAHWTAGEEVLLRGRSTPTRLAHPT